MKRREDQEPTSPVDEAETLIHGAHPEDFFGEAEDLRFDYAAFEQSLEPPVSADASPPQAAVGGVQQRKTIDDRSFPKDDAVYEVKQLGNYQVVTIRGQINESFQGRALGSQLQGAVLFDLTEVDRVTSFGVRAWLEMLDAARLTFAAFIRSSPAIVNQITMMRNFCGSAKLQSIVAPYGCPSCGNGFGVPFDAVADQKILRSRNPPKVYCPDCRAPAEMDEDPWVYFDLDDHLLDSVPPDLRQVLAHLGDGPRRPPIEKALAGEVTRIRLNGAVTTATRLQRAFGGLEGKVALDLRTVSEIDAGGIDNLMQRLEKLPEEVTRVTLEGAPLEMVERLTARRLPQVFVNSVFTNVRSLSRPLRRRVCIDLRRHRPALQARVAPDLDLPWRDDPVELEGQDLLLAALGLLPPEASTPRAPTPPGAPAYAASGGYAAASGGYAAASGGYAAAGSYGRTPSGVSPGYAQSSPSLVPPPPRPRPGGTRVQLPWGPLFALAGALFVVVFVGVLGIALLAGGGLASAPSDELVIPDEGWSTGGALPPPWAELQLAESNGAILATGRGEADSAEAALALARDNALAALLVVAGRELRPSFEDEVLPPDGSEARIAAMRHWREAAAGLALMRLQDAARRVEGGFEVVAQYAIDRREFDALAGSYARQVSFRGLTLAPRAPWQPPGLRLVRRESYIRNVEPGDVLRTVGAVPVTAPDAFQLAAEQSYLGLDEGESLSFVFDRGGVGVVTSIYKPRARPAPEPAQTSRPTLFRKD